MKLTDTEKANLSAILRSPLFEKALGLTGGLKKAPANTIESCALAQAYNEGSEARIDAIYELCGADKPAPLQPKRLRKLS